MEKRNAATPSTNGPASESERFALTDLGEIGRPVFFDGEDEGEYDRLTARVIAAVRPSDAIEEFWVRDVVDLMWEMLRLRRLKVHLLNASLAEGLKKILSPMFRNYMEVDAVVGDWYAGEQDMVKDVEELLARASLTMDHVRAQTLSAKLDDIERIDRMVAAAEARRHVVLREMERLRTASEAIEDGEFSDVAAKGLPHSTVD